MSTVIITGASKGIGAATAELLTEVGHDVINISRTECNVAGVTNQCIDLTSADAAAEVATFAQSLDTGEIHLIHNAARLTNETVKDLDLEDFRLTLEINMIAPQILNTALIPMMQPGSSIIYIGSTLSEKAVPNSYSYVVSKHAMIGMMRATCQDLAGTGIHTACVCPGFTDTEMLRTHVGHSEEVLTAIGGMSAFGRLIEPTEIASSIKFAIENPVINGATIHANLGQIES